MPARTSLSLTATLKRLRRNREGSAIIEFAMAAPLVVMAIIGIVEFSMILFVNSLLESTPDPRPRASLGHKRQPVFQHRLFASTPGVQ